MSATKNNNMGGIPVKVVIINTQYVETDATSFKSVVQRLTGKNSNVTVEEAATVAAPPPPLPPVAASYNGSRYCSNYWDDDQNNAAGGGCSCSSLGRLKSFNEIDKLFKELPPLDDLLPVYADELQQQQYTQYNFTGGVYLEEIERL